MKKQYRHLTKAERLEIGILLGKGYSRRAVATALGKDHTSISREIKRGRRSRISQYGQPEDYQATVAQQKAYVRRKYAKYQGKKINEDQVLEACLVARLKRHWNPDEISGAMKRHRRCSASSCRHKENDCSGGSIYASKTAIYAWLYSEWGQQYCRYLYAERYRPKKRIPKAQRVMIPDRVSISERPRGATTRSRYGHSEGDTMVSGKKTGSLAAIAVIYERKSRYLDARKLANLKPDSFTQAVASIQVAQAPLKSLSLDNGIENRHHAAITQATGAAVFFCEPYSSWQKGGVENANKMLRRYLPKGSDLSEVSQTQLQRIVAIINDKPRKILGYKSALQVMQERGLLRQTGT